MPQIPSIALDFAATAAQTTGTNLGGRADGGSFATLLNAARQIASQAGAGRISSDQAGLSSLLNGQEGSLDGMEIDLEDLNLDLDGMDLDLEDMNLALEGMELTGALAGLENLQILQQLLAAELAGTDTGTGTGTNAVPETTAQGNASQQTLLAALLENLEQGVTKQANQSPPPQGAQEAQTAGQHSTDLAQATVPQTIAPSSTQGTATELSSLFVTQAQQGTGNEQDQLVRPEQQRANTATPQAQTAGDEQKPSTNGKVIVERWSASFTPATETREPTSSDTLLQKQPAPAMTAPATTITVSAAVSPETYKLSQPAPAAPTTDGSALRQDANSSYISSHLPGVEQEDSGGETGQQQEQSQEKQAKSAKSQLQAELGTKVDGGKNSTAIFSLDTIQPVTSTPTQQTGNESPMIKLPSGITIPEQRVMDQVVSQFTMNRRLETGSITMRLYPQELGELRIEIKVEQDNIKAHITTQNPQVQEVLDRHMPRLREALGLQGMHLEQVEVTVAANDNTDTQQFQDQQREQRATGSSRMVSEQEGFEDLLTDEQHDNETPSLNLLI